MKKILFILPSLTMGGLERLQVNLANALVARGHDVTILMLDNIRDLESELDSKVHLQYKPYKKTWFAKLPYIRSKFYDDGMWETRTSPKKLHEYYVGSEKYDVEIAFFRGLSIKIVSGCTDKTVKKLAWVHNDFSKAVGYNNNFKSIDDVIKAYKRFDNVVCVSNQAKEGFVSVLGDLDNLKIIYNLSPIEKIIELSKKNIVESNVKHNFNLVVVARLVDDAKGQLRLINVIDKLNKNGLDVGLTIVGDGVDKDKISQKINELNAGEYINMVGMQKNPYPYIRGADLLVCSSYFEGYNLTVAEALILGVPVLSTKCAGPCEILENGKYGLLVENSEEGLFEGLLKLIRDKDLFEYYKKMAIKRRDFFSEEKIIKQVEELF